jgi:hypothetical protein
MASLVAFMAMCLRTLYFSGVLNYITQHSVPDVSQEHTAFIFKGLESEKNTS